MAHKKPEAQTKRPAIKQAAMEAMCQYGYDGASVQSIAQKAGVAPSLVIKYFGSKQALAVVCLREFINTFAEILNASAAKGQSYGAHTAYMFAQFQKYRPQWRLLLSVMLIPAHEQLCREFMPEYLAVAKAANRLFPAQLAAVDVDNFSYTIVALHLAYVIGGNVPNCQNAKDAALARYLAPHPGA